MLLHGRVRALQSYRSILGNSDDDLLVKASERKKFGSLHTIGSNGNSSSRRHHQNSGHHQPGSKRSWGSAKEDDTLSSSSEDAEEEDNLMECAIKPYPTHRSSEGTMCGISTSTSTNSTAAVSSSSSSSSTLSHQSHQSPRNPSSTSGVQAVHYLTPQDSSIPPSENIHHSNSFRLRQQIPLMDPRSPRVRLSRPGSNSVRVIPPLRGLERVFCCAWCHTQLFNLASVIRTDIRIAPLSDSEEAAVWAAQKHGTEHLDSYPSHNLFPLSVPQAAKEDLHEKESSSYLMPAPSPRGSNISFSNASFPDDAKITSLPMSANNSFNSPNGSRGGVNGDKSPPKTMRSKAAKTFDFEEAEEPVSRGTPRTNLFTVNEATQPKISYDHTVEGGGIGSGGGQGERATSPMEISDEKSTHMVIKRTGSSGMKDEKSSLAIEPPPVSSRRGSFHGNFSLQTHTEGFDRHDDQTNHINHSRPGSSSSSSYRSKAPGGISNLSVNHSHPVAINGTESPRITFPHGSRESFAYPSPRNRPQSAEKRRWLARVNLLKSDHDLDEKDDDMEDQHAKASSSDHFGQNFRPSPKHDEKVAKLSHDDDQAIK